MSIIAEIKEKPLQGVIVFLLLVIAAALVYHVIVMSKLHNEVTSVSSSSQSIIGSVWEMKEAVNSLSTAVANMRTAVSTIGTTLNTVNSSLNSMKNADVFSIRLIRLTSGNTWMFPVASAAWSGR